MEEWRPIDGFSGKYEVSNMGKVRRVARVIEVNGKPHNLHCMRLKLSKHRSGYIYAHLFDENVVKNVFVHRLVAFAFPEICGEYFEKATVDHLNGVRTDNRASNLRFKTIKDNQRNPVTYPKKIEIAKKNLEKACTKKAVEKMKMSQSKPVKCLETGKEYWSRFEAFRDTNASPSGIYKCCSGCQKTSGGLHWVFA